MEGACQLDAEQDADLLLTAQNERVDGLELDFDGTLFVTSRLMQSRDRPVNMMSATEIGQFIPVNVNI